MIFCHKPELWLTPNGRMWSLRRKSSPRVNELDENWSLWTKKRPCWFSWYFSKAILFFLQPIHGYSEIFLVFDETFKWSKIHPIRLETFIQVEIRVEIQGFGEKTSRPRKIPFLTMTCHNHVSGGIPSGTPFEKAFKTINERMDSRSKCLVLIIFSRKTQKKIHGRPTITGMDAGRQDFDRGDSKKNHRHFEASWKNPKSKKCSTELNIGRSETNEDSTSM